MRPSWVSLTASDRRHELPDAPLDAGWVEQMLPFVADLSRPGDLVLDPFAGWGTTLVACALLGRRARGLEIEPARVDAANARLAALPGDHLVLRDQLVLCADARRPPLAPASVDLCLTSVPYFSADGHAGWDLCEAPGQIYRARDYGRYLGLLAEVFGAVAGLLRPGAHLVAFAENLTLPDGTLLPLAWDLARVLATRLVLLPERVLCYERPLAQGADPTRTNRAHEYALVARRPEI